MSQSTINQSLNGSWGCNSSGEHGGRGSDNTQAAVSLFIHTYFLPVLVFIGLLGNSLSSYTFLGKGLRNISSTVYVQAVLISDTGVLLSLMLVWLEVLGYRYYQIPYLCQFSVYWSYICTFLSVWYVVCITVENYITICQPTKIQTMCTVRRATIVTTSLAGFAVSAYLVSIFTTSVQIYKINGKNIHMCTPSPELHQITSMVSYIDSFVTLLIPMVLITLMMIAISLSIIRSVRKKRKRSALPSKNKSKTASIPQVRVAKMLYILVITFLVLNAPSHITRLYFIFRNIRGGTSNGTYREAFIQFIFQFVYYCNFSVKFALFFICSQNFRKSFMRLCVKSPGRKYSTVSTDC